ncbi:sugar kinase [Pseudarthrobacter oxydans]|uniref:sugar kinase n=1 Tax=Pseudarthrobacter oxydans TaxID=1671 RepID=UPI003449978D
MSETGRTDVVCMGETMALFNAQHAGPLSHSRSFNLGIGGAESNVAIALTRLGARAAWVGRLGADSLGDVILHELRGEGVLVHASRDSEAPTGLMIKERRTAATQRVWYHRRDSAGSRLEIEDLPTSLLAETRVLHVTGITPALSSTAHATIERAIDCVRESGGAVSLDVNYRSGLWEPEEASAALLPITANCDIIFAGSEEAQMLTGEMDAHTQAQSLAALGPSQVLIKLGAAGCAGLIDGKWFTQAAIPITPVDTVGAGDAFVAGYLAELLAGLHVEQRLETAVRCGAYACLAAGDWEGLPRRSELALIGSSEAVTR